MTVRVEAAVWTKALRILNRVRPRTTPQPTLQCVLIEDAEAGWLRLTATDLEMGIVVRVPCTGCLGKPLLARDLPAKPRGFVTLEHGKEDMYLVGTAAGTGTFITGGNPDDYPTVGVGKDAKPWGSWGAGDLLPALEYALRAAAREAARYAIHNVAFEGDTKRLAIVATDTHRLHWTDDLAPPQTAGTFLMPVSTAELLVKSGAGVLRFTVGSRDAAVEFGNVRLVFRLAEGNFPKWREAIPGDAQDTATLDTASTLRALKDVLQYTSAETRATAIQTVKGRLVVSGRTPERGEGFVWGGEVEGTLHAGFYDPLYLSDALTGIPTVAVDTAAGENRPMILRSGRHNAVVMPVRIKDGGTITASAVGPPPPEPTTVTPAARGPAKAELVTLLRYAYRALPKAARASAWGKRIKEIVNA